MSEEHGSKSRTKPFTKLAYDSVYRPGIDLAIVIAIVCSIIDIVSLFVPWLVGINSVYVPGKGLTYKIAILLSGIELFRVNPYLTILVLPLVLTVVLIFLSIRPEGLIPPRIGYKTKSRILLLVAAFSSMLPGYAFMHPIMLGTFSVPNIGVFVGRWELGGGATMPLYAGFGFMLALGLKIIKD